MISQVEIPLAQILNPSTDEFNDFESFVETLDRDGTLQNYGMAKVVPPPKWKAKNNGVEAALDEVVVSSPIEQNVQGRAGIYELLLMQKKTVKLNEYRKKVNCFDHLTDNKSFEEAEDLFWKNIVFSPPLYGADISGKTLFDSEIPWNLNELPGILRQGLKTSIAGVTTSYLYIGSWKSMFGWHKEDMDLYSINYNHYGKPKFWYCLPASEGKKLEDFAKLYFGERFSKCKEFLRHKTIMIHPYLLKQKIPDLKIYKMIQNPGEFVITGGGAYHAGFNWGFNIAEAVNFATTRWLEILPHADACRCIGDSVRINKTEFFKNILSDEKYGKIPEIKKICFDNGVTKPRDPEPQKEEEQAKIGLNNKRDSEGQEVLRRSQRRSTSTKLFEDIYFDTQQTHKRSVVQKNKTPVEKISTRKKGNTLLTEHEEILPKEKTTSLLSQSKKIKKLPIIDPSERRRTRSMKNQEDNNKDNNHEGKILEDNTLNNHNQMEEANSTGSESKENFSEETNQTFEHEGPEQEHGKFEGEMVHQKGEMEMELE